MKIEASVWRHDDEPNKVHMRVGGKEVIVESDAFSANERDLFAALTEQLDERDRVMSRSSQR